MIPSLWADLCGWLLPGLPFLPGAPWPRDVMQSDIFWVHVWPDEHLDIVVNLSENSLVKSSVDLMHLDFGDLAAGGLAALAAWMGAVPVGLLSGWVVQQNSSLGPQLTSHMLGDPREQDQVCLQCTSMSGSCVVGLWECLVARGWDHRGFHTGELETHCWWLAWFAQGPGQWAGHLGWFVSDAVVGTDGGVVCYLQIWCQSWHRLRQCLYCWHLQAVWWLCMLHCTAGNWCCQWLSPLGACLLLFHSPLPQWTGLCVGVFSLFWLWQLVVLSPFHDFWNEVDDGMLAD